MRYKAAVTKQVWSILDAMRLCQVLSKCCGMHSVLTEGLRRGSGLILHREFYLALMVDLLKATNDQRRSIFVCGGQEVGFGVGSRIICCTPASQAETWGMSVDSVLQVILVSLQLT